MFYWNANFYKTDAGYIAVLRRRSPCNSPVQGSKQAPTPGRPARLLTFTWRVTYATATPRFAIADAGNW